MSTKTDPARAFRTRDEARPNPGQRVYKVTGTTPLGRRTRYVIGTPGDLDGMRAEFLRETGLAADAEIDFFALPG